VRPAAAVVGIAAATVSVISYFCQTLAKDRRACFGTLRERALLWGSSTMAEINGRDRHDERHRTTFTHLVSRFAERVTAWTGSSLAFTLAVAAVLVWGALGPLFHYSDTWQLVINTSTTIVTFLMVFLIQRAQNKESLAVQLKLNAAVEGASNRLISVEDLSEEELNVLRGHYKKLALMSAREGRITESHSVEEAEARHAFKRDRRRKGDRQNPGGPVVSPKSVSSEGVGAAHPGAE
jgi:low affinity Fe/Cu permease